MLRYILAVSILFAFSSVANAEFSLVKVKSSTSYSQPEKPVAEAEPVQPVQQVPQQTPQSDQPQIINISDVPPTAPETEETGETNLEMCGAEEPVEVGELVQLWVKLSGEQPYSVNYSWTVLPNKEDIVTWPDGSKILFGTGISCESYTVIMTASMVYVEYGNNNEIVGVTQKSITLHKDVKITLKTDIVTQVDPEPEPEIQEETQEQNTTVDLTLQANAEQKEFESKVATLAYSWVEQVNRTPQYTDDDVKDDAKKLYASFMSVVSDIESGELTNINMILDATVTRNSILTNPDAWTIWFSALSSKIEIMYKNGELDTIGDIAATWSAVANGLVMAAE